MTLRVTIEVVPHGDESRKYKLHTFDIGNIGMLALSGRSLYNVRELAHDPAGGDPKIYQWQEEIIHKRDRGALRLAWEVLGIVDLARKEEVQPKTKPTGKRGETMPTDISDPIFKQVMKRMDEALKKEKPQKAPEDIDPAEFIRREKAKAMKPKAFKRDKK